MTAAKRAGIAVAAMLLAQRVASPIVSFALLQPIFRPVSLPFFGLDIVFPLLAPLGLCRLALAIRLFVRGFAEPAPAG